MEINQDMLFNFLIYSRPIPFTQNIICYPVMMENVVEFQRYSQALMVRKDSMFPKKEILKMQYLEFLYFAYGNQELEQEYLYYKSVGKENTEEVQINNNVVGISIFYEYTIALLKIICRTDDILIDKETGYFQINGDVIDYDKFDDLRRIIFIQNEIDFDIDEFMNIETLMALEKAKEFEERKRKEKTNIEDYIDSLIVALKLTEDEVSKMSVRKFWRYIKRIQLQEDCTAARTGEMSGMVTFKEPIKYWMTSFEKTDKYKDVKADENELRGKLG